MTIFKYYIKKRLKTLFMRSINICIIICFTVTSSGAYAMDSRTLFKNKSYAERLVNEKQPIGDKVTALTIPSECGDIIQSHQGKKQGLIINIQDRHADSTAQLNIAGMISAITDNYGIDLLCLEGASDKLDTSFYDKIPKTLAKELTSEFFVKEGLFTGAEYYKILNADKDITAYGVEDRALYRNHVSAYKSHNATQEEAYTYLQKLNSGLSALKPYIFSKALNTIAKNKHAYSNKEIGLAEYVSFITEKINGKDIPLSDYPSLEAFSNAESIKNRLDFKEVEVLRDLLIKRLSELLDDEDLNQLVEDCNLKCDK